jgi:CRP/FNR family transcriptional regulator, cyclic AMP receptor protein
MADRKVDALKAVPLFAKFSGGQLKALASMMDEASVPAEQTLIEQGSLGHAFYILLSGAADVIVDGKHRRRMGAGDFFGEISMIDRGPATATVRTTQPCTLMALSHRQFASLIHSDDTIGLRVMQAMASRLREDSTARG